MLPGSENVASVDALFGTYHDRIHRYIVGMVRDPGTAEDLTQETFLRAYRGGDTLRDPNAVRGWLYRIATNACLDYLRQRKAEVSIGGEEAAVQVQQAVSPTPSPQELTERKETSACVQRCLDFLSDSYRTVLLLHEVHGLTSPEVAALLGVETGAVKIRLLRARRKLQQLMEYGCAVADDKGGMPVCQPRCGVSTPDKP